MAAHPRKAIPPFADASASDVESERCEWVRLVSRFIDLGEPMADAMVAASRIVAYWGARPLEPEDDETPRASRHVQSGTDQETERPPRFVPPKPPK